MRYNSKNLPDELIGFTGHGTIGYETIGYETIGYETIGFLANHTTRNGTITL
ncbi:MAG: hypothetical protein JXJ04_07020 [Spirochaetales bacterium]|nr:hypothetical protein [Spirochaetales bacterium]